ncbi:ABC transporter ATP-binding protein [Clostridium estertheticum]|uniref:ABC transporter ATP-binding protein n=1 Tax=Clostridium estertheticum TaxID=238834 RepID=UPI001C0AE675|nr:ABC transporter ATP-binding protein [Clostridium estertheticum]MBU3214729.1 ABC transporter ATP-binding protein [Clostridium estertheticum]WAG57141.1 ABC transporter ATP-binding protein [Clostridium estertheticum]
MKKVLLSAEDVCKSFETGGNLVNLLNYVNVEFYEGDFTVIMGASGAGKSTLLYALSGMNKISEGKVLYKDKEISSFNEKQIASLRSQDFGFVFQQTNLVSNLTLFENVAVAGYLGKERSTKETYIRTEELLKQMHVSNAKDRLPSEVSGGEAQRAAVARAIINKPRIVFADEPTGALNKHNTEEVLNIISELNKSGQSIIMVTHDLRAALRGNRLLYLEDGKIIGEKEMPSYTQSDAKDREAQLNNWLASMEW